MYVCVRPLEGSRHISRPSHRIHTQPYHTHLPDAPCANHARGGLTLIATYRSVEEYKKRAAIQAKREAAKAAAFAKAAEAAEREEAEAAARAAAPGTLARAK